MGTSNKVVKWVKDHPKSLVAAGAGASAAAGAYGYDSEKVTGALKFAFSLLGLM